MQKSLKSTRRKFELKSIHDETKSIVEEHGKKLIWNSKYFMNSKIEVPINLI